MAGEAWVQIFAEDTVHISLDPWLCIHGYIAGTQKPGLPMFQRKKEEGAESLLTTRNCSISQAQSSLFWELLVCENEAAYALG